MKSDTPMTDAIFINCQGDPKQIAQKQYVQNIERALNAAQARIAELEGELEGHAWKISPAMAEARIEQLFAENEQLKAKIAELGFKAAPTPLPRPDKPGWWWNNWNDEFGIALVWDVPDGQRAIKITSDGFVMEFAPTGFTSCGQWRPATPPPAPKEETK